MDPNLITIITTAIATLIGSLGLPSLYKHLTSKKQIESDSVCRDKIQAFELRLNQITTGVEMLLIIIEDKFDEGSHYNNVIAKVKQILDNDENQSNS